MKKFVKALLDQCLSQFIRPEQLILKIWKNDQLTLPVSHKSPRRLVLFAHFDPNGQVAPYVIYYLQCLRHLNADIIFISTAKILADSEVDPLLPYCLQIIHRKNLGLDFGSWRIGLLCAQQFMQSYSSYDELILANDSVYGPLFPLEEAFQAMSKKDLDLWGMTQNQEIQPHLQSYFLVFNKRAFTSPEFQNFWKNFRYYRSKRRLIQLYELGFSRLAKNYGWKVDSFIAANIGSGIQVDSNGQELNPTLYHWDTLIEKFRFPFLKTEVLRLNRTQSPRIHDWKQILSNHTNYKPELIQSHLTSVKN